jgi:hypothetical protein
MARKTNERVYIRILWGDADLGEVSKRLSSLRHVTVGRGFFADLRTKIWPLREDLTILEREAGRVFLNSSIPWHGMMTTGEAVQVLDPRKKRRRNYEIKPHTYATLRYEDVTIAIRVGFDHPVYRLQKAVAEKLKGSLLGLIADTKLEQIGLLAAMAVSLVFIGAVTGGLKNRETWRPTSVNEIADEVRLPFISPDHFATAPQVLQDKLDRFKYIDSVADFYNDLAGTLTEPNRSSNPFDFPDVTQVYKQAFRQQKEALSQAEASNKQLVEENAGRGGLSLSMPVVQGESLDGTMQRILDKIDILSASAVEVVEARSKTAQDFENDAAYDYSDKGGGGKDTLAEFTKKLGEGYRSALPDEEQQVLEAKNLSVQASSVQAKLFGQEHLVSGVHNCCGEIVGVPVGAIPLTFTPPGRASSSDSNLGKLKASVWGAPIENHGKPKVVEPLAGVIDEKAVEKLIGQGRFQLQLCFELALRRNQAAKGTMEWKWQINSGGNLSELSLVSSTLKDQELIQCVRKRIAGWKFPKPRGGSVEIRYPFEFSRDKG